MLSLDTFLESHVNTSFHKKILAQSKLSRSIYSLFTDIDNTLWHDQTVPSMWKVIKMLEQRNWPLVVVTGLAPESVIERVNAEVLPKPDLIAGALGSIIMVNEENGRYVIDDHYQAHIQTLLMNEEDVRRRFDSIPHHLKQRFQLVFQVTSISQHGGLIPKIGLFARLTSPRDVQECCSILELYFPGKQVIVSKHVPGKAEPLNDFKYCIDIATVTKRTAVDYICELFRVDQAIVAGDSGNDIDMLFASHAAYSVIVGNAEQSVLSKALQLNINLHTQKWIKKDKHYYGSDRIAADALHDALLALPVSVYT